MLKELLVDSSLNPCLFLYPFPLSRMHKLFFFSKKMVSVDIAKLVTMFSV